MFCTPMFEELLYVINRYTESEDRGYRLHVIAVIYKKRNWNNLISRLLAMSRRMSAAEKQVALELP